MENSNQMEVIQAVYDEMIEELAEMHSRWVESNFAMRSMELAKSQIESKGDIKIDYASKVLSDHYEKLKVDNEDMTDRLHAKREFVARFRWRVKELSGYDVDGGGDKIRDIYGY